MKRISIIMCLAVLAVSCKKVQYYPEQQAKTPEKQGHVNVSPIPTPGPLTMSFNLQPSIKYNVTIKDMSGKVYKSYGISSIEGILVKQDNLTGLPSGTYDLILMNINGQETRTPIIIK
jgi:PBP1b-binding outer membrane lipoprotein LpoB